MTETRLRARKNRILLLIGAVIVVVFALAFAQLTMTAIHVRKQTSDVFMQWVLDHHVGTAQLVTDSSGFDGAFVVLTLSKPIVGAQIPTQSLALMKEYYSLDGGQSLTIQYHDKAKNTTEQVSSVQYIEAEHTVYINVHTGPDAGKVFQRKVHWPNVPDSTD